jgi:hypothetical protein
MYVASLHLFCDVYYICCINTKSEAVCMEKF